MENFENAHCEGTIRRLERQICLQFLVTHNPVFVRCLLHNCSIVQWAQNPGQPNILVIRTH